MPQEMNVLCCYSCSMYQVHIVKKSSKWQCKICGEKQSIQVIHFQGSGSDCRKHVQHVNFLKSTNEDQRSFRSASIDGYGLDCATDESGIIESCDCSSKTKLSVGKWTQYLDTVDKEESSCESSYDKENFSSLGSHQRHDKLNLKRKQRPCSLPASQNSSDIESEPKKNCFQPRTSRSRTYPLVDNSPTICGNKWEKFLNNRKESCSGKASKSKKPIFEDSNDDLDMTIDF